MKNFCLHHPVLTERFEFLKKDFEKLQLDVDWITGYCPDEIEIPQGAIFKNKAEYSLYLKQLHCLKEQYEQNIDYIVVFEDDVILPENYNSHLIQCIKEFDEMQGDILFLGICCGIKPSNIVPDKKVYWEPGYLSRCAHCYLVPLRGCKKIYPHLIKNEKAYDFKLNEIIQIENLKSCYAEPGIHQGTQGGKYPSSLNNHNGK